MQGVVRLIQSRTYPVEVHHLPTFVLVEVEGSREFHITHPVVQVDACMQFFLVKAQLLVVSTL